MNQFVSIFATLFLVAFVAAQDFQQGLSIHNQQIQEHLRKEQEQQRQTGAFGGGFQQFNQPPPQQYNHNQYNNQVEDDGQYRPELYNNPSNFQQQPASPDAVYQAGIAAHQEQIRAVLAKEAAFQPQANHLGDPAYQQGLQIHQRQLQAHIAQEQQLGGGAHHTHHHQPAAPRTYEPAPSVQYHSGGDATYDQGITLHQQQLLQHQRAEEQHRAQVGSATQYHQSQQRYDPPAPQPYNNQPQQNSYQPRASISGKVSLAQLGF